MSGTGSSIASAFGLNVAPRATSKPLITEVGGAPEPAPQTTSSSLLLGGGTASEDAAATSAAPATKPMISVLSSVESPATKPALIQPTEAPKKKRGPLIREHVAEVLPDFQPAETFAGLRTGFVFQAGPQGNGYYRDDPGRPGGPGFGAPASSATAGKAKTQMQVRCIAGPPTAAPPPPAASASPAALASGRHHPLLHSPGSLRFGCAQQMHHHSPCSKYRLLISVNGPFHTSGLAVLCA